MKPSVRWNEISGYKSYASSEAYDLAVWALETPNRIKASKMKKIADKMETKKRNSGTVRKGTLRKGLSIYYIGELLKECEYESQK